MAKKNLLAANLKRPNLKREMKVTEEAMNEVVRKVADNQSPAPVPQEPLASHAPPTSPDGGTGLRPAEGATAPASAPAPAPEPKRGRGRPPKAAADKTPSPRSVHPADGTKRLTLDIPQALHKKLKLLAIHQEISMKDYIIEVVERSLP